MVFSDGDSEFTVTSEKDLHRAKRGRMGTQRARNVVPWGFPTRGFLLLISLWGHCPDIRGKVWHMVFLKNAL